MRFKKPQNFNQHIRVNSYDLRKLAPTFMKWKFSTNPLVMFTRKKMTVLENNTIKPLRKQLGFFKQTTSQ